MDRRIVAGLAGFLALSGGSASAATTSCSSVSACLFGNNASSGPGTQGTSKSGFGISGISTSGHGVNGTSSGSFGVVGITTANATSYQTARAGVVGEDLSTNKKAFNTGVAGTSSYGYGVTGYGGVYGGKFTGGGGVFTTGMDVDPYGVIGSTSQNGTYYGGGGYFNVYGVSDDGGEDGFPPSLELNAVGCSIDPSDPTPSPQNCGSVFDVYSDGTGYFGGTLYTAGSDVVRTKSAIGKDVTSFNARSASPTIEDFGTATLRNGSANVALDKTFASTIAPGYMVFVTPHADSNSLYTTDITPSGFVVKESKGGRSTLAFDYRIVAKPLDAKAMHMPLTTAFPAFTRRSGLKRRTVAR